jgi:hypothetical protein
MLGFIIDSVFLGQPLARPQAMTARTRSLSAASGTRGAHRVPGSGGVLWWLFVSEDRLIVFRRPHPCEPTLKDADSGHESRPRGLRASLGAASRLYGCRLAISGAAPGGRWLMLVGRPLSMVLAYRFVGACRMDGSGLRVWSVPRGASHPVWLGPNTIGALEGLEFIPEEARARSAVVFDANSGLVRRAAVRGDLAPMSGFGRVRGSERYAAFDSVEHFGGKYYARGFSARITRDGAIQYGLEWESSAEVGIPAASPDRHWAAWPARLVGPRLPIGIFVGHLDGTSARRIASLPDRPGGIGDVVSGLAWSPDGRRLAFKYNAAIYVIAALPGTVSGGPRPRESRPKIGATRRVGRASAGGAARDSGSAAPLGQPFGRTLRRWASERP